MDNDTDNYIYINTTGQLESAYFPLGIHNSKLFCRYDIKAGPDWEFISGLQSGVTQLATAGYRMDKIIFNLPLEFMYKSTNPYGWPQIIFSLYGTNWWGKETSFGYARIHLPIGIGNCKLRAPILILKYTNFWSALSSWITDRNPELKDPRILMDGTKSKSLSINTYGELIVSLQSITRDEEKLSLVW